MRLSLPARIFLVQLLFVLTAGGLVFVFVERTFQSYYDNWARRMATVPSERLYDAFAVQVGRSLLLRLERIPEIQERDAELISRGVNALLQEIPAIESLVIVDAAKRIRYSNDTAALDLAFSERREPERFALLDGTDIRRISRTGASGGPVTEVFYPIFDRPAADGSQGRRLGSMVVLYRPADAQALGLPEIERDPPSTGRFVDAIGVLLVAMVASALAVSALTLLPLRRLDRALREYRERGFRGRIDAKGLGLGGELASTVQAINEMGGRLEALDERGREREALLATLSRSLEDGMLALGADGAPVTWNAAAGRILGLAVSGDGGTEVEAFREAVASVPDLRPRGEVGSREVHVTRPDGSKTPVQVTEMPFELRPGVPGTLLLMRDLATLRMVEDHLLEAGRFAVLAHLAGSLAHEIRNPLHSIGLNAGVVEQYVDSPSSEDRRRAILESLQTIQNETRRLTDLLNNYLGLLRSAPEPGPVDVRELCRRVIQLLSYAAMKSRVEISLEGDADVPPVHGVPDRLQQAVLNLVLNAIQAMPNGGRVSLRTSSEAGLVRIVVQDNGPGLPEDIAEALFESRVTTKPGGSGLGLPLVRLIVEAHGGSIWYRSNPGQGAVFTMVLPSERRAA